VPPSSSTGSASGKIILSGEYAVLFGHRGIAVPSNETVDVTWEEDPSMKEVKILWSATNEEAWIDYIRQILDLLKGQTGELHGTLSIRSTIPLGKGMGSSTALIIALCRCLLGAHSAKPALIVEDTLNPNHSGLDFAVIRESHPLIYQKDKVPERIKIPLDLLNGATLIDTGTPNEMTRELIAWVRSRATEPDVKKALETIGECTERLARGEPLRGIVRDHHRAQIKLGVVPESTQKIIADIEKAGGFAKVIGAGGKTGGGGMVLRFA